MPSRFCTECGTELKPGQRFCPECGTAVQSPAAEATATQPATTQPAATKGTSAVPARTVNKRPPMALMLGVAGLAVLIVVAVVFVVMTRPPALVGNFPKETSPDGLPFPDVPRISVEDAKAAADAGDAIIVDVRSRAQYTASHIPGSLLIPLDEFEARYTELPQNTQILTYCT